MSVVQDLMEKAEQAVASAHLLAEAGDLDGAAPVSLERARWAVDQAGHFCAAIKALPISAPESR